MIESYVLKFQIQDTYTLTYMETLSGEHADEYYNAMDDEINSIMRRDTWGVVSSKSVDAHNMLPGTWYFKCKRKIDFTIRKFKARYCVRGDVQNRLCPEPLKLYSPVV